MVRLFYISPQLGESQIRIAGVLKSQDLARAAQVLGAGLKAFNAK